MEGGTDRVDLPAGEVRFLFSLDLVQMLQLGLVLGAQGLQVPGVLHDAIHCDALLHIRVKDAVQQASALG